jgi:hypothetical protein
MSLVLLPRSRGRSAWRVPTLVACVLLGGASAASPGSGVTPCSYDATLIEAPDGPFGPENIVLYDINDAGVAVGRVSYLITYLPCLWTAEGGVKVLPQAPGMVQASAVAINDNGWILVNGQSASGYFGAFVYVPFGGEYAAVTFPGPPGHVQALGINDKNQVVGMQKMQPVDGQVVDAGFLWTPGGAKVDIQISGWKSTWCTDINNDGVICGNVAPTSGADPAATGVRAFVLDSGKLTMIEPPAPYVKSAATRINGGGVVGGDVRFGAGGNTQSAGFFFDSKGGWVNVVAPPNDAFRWTLRDLNDVGVASGVFVQTAEGGNQPCIATQAGVTAIAPLFEQQYAAATQEALAIASDYSVLVKKGSEMLFSDPVYGGADLDCDGAVGAADLAELLAAWGKIASSADLDADGVVDGADIGILLGAWAR